MARPVKWRKIACKPKIHYYVPSAQEKEGVEETILLLEELEAIRLKDYEGLEQAQCAKEMEVSRPTFQRILSSAREKLADSILHGKSIHIEGGTYTTKICHMTCKGCLREWKESYERMKDGTQNVRHCPSCGSKAFQCDETCKNGCCK